ncbi:MAG: efflux RND transporter periplasmic adaptor subunit [Gemmatimonadaceae bacterium]
MRQTFALASLAAAALIAGCGKKDEAAPAGPQMMTVGPEAIAVVRQETIRSGPILSGALEAEQEALVRAEVPGSVRQVYVDAGQPVPRGALLARLDDRAIRDQVTSARSAVATAQANAQLAAREVERTEALVRAGALADRALEQVRAQASAANAQLAAARAQLAGAAKQLGYTEVRAPFTGVVSVRQVSAGDVVSPGAPMFGIVNPATMRLEASVPAEAVGAVRLGMPVEFSVSGYGGRRFTGRITRVSPTADPVTRQVGIIASIPNAGATLVGGLFAEGRVASEQKTGLVVPASAIDERGIRPMVLRLKAGKAEAVPVSVGVQDQASETVEISAPGITVGDTVLLGAARAISPGTPVRVGRVADQPKR